MLHKVKTDTELYVYHNGTLIYKKWLRTGASKVFEKYGPPTSQGDRNNAP